MADGSDQGDNSGSRRRRADNGVRQVGRGLGLGFHRGGRGLWSGLVWMIFSLWAGLKLAGSSLWEVTTQSGWRDLYVSSVGTLVLLIPLWIVSEIAQTLGIGVVEDVLCNTGQTGTSVSQLVLIGLGLITMFFIMKTLIYAVVAIDKVEDSETEPQTVAYSFGAALLPAFILTLLQFGGVNVASCLFL